MGGSCNDVTLLLREEGKGLPSIFRGGYVVTFMFYVYRFFLSSCDSALAACERYLSLGVGGRA